MVNEPSKFFVVSLTSHSFEDYQGQVKAHSLYFEASGANSCPTAEDTERAFARAIIMENRTPRSKFPLGHDAGPEMLLGMW